MGIAEEDASNVDYAAGAFSAFPTSLRAQTSDSDFASFDGVETVKRIERGDISPLEAVASAIDRASDANKTLNAVSTETFFTAQKIADRRPNGPFMGTPTFVKDLVDVAGVPTGNGSRAFTNYVPSAQYPFVDDLASSGLVSLGKSATPEFGLTATTEPLSQGPTLNPWHTEYSPGGSSGGAAALVAARVIPIAHASDGGGSIRIPASCCGLVGLKVSRDRFRAARNEPPAPIRLSVQGAVTRTVRDTAGFLAVMENRTQHQDGLKPVGLIARPAARRLKIAFYTDGSTGEPTDPTVTEVVNKAARLCESLGHEITDIPPLCPPEFLEDFILYWSSFADSAINDWEEENARIAGAHDFEAFTFGLRDFFRDRRREEKSVIDRLNDAAQSYHRLFADYDVIVSPVTASPPPKIGYLGPNVDFTTAVERLMNYVQFTGIANVAGAPSISLPIGMSANGLPIGVLFNARYGDEATLLSLSFELEEATQWSDRMPPFSM
ncbi:MAG: amidase [Pseudomonadota bacterium]